MQIIVGPMVSIEKWLLFNTFLVVALIVKTKRGYLIWFVSSSLQFAKENKKHLEFVTQEKPGMELITQLC